MMKYICVDENIIPPLVIFKVENCQYNEFRRVFMITEDSIVIQKDG